MRPWLVIISWRFEANLTAVFRVRLSWKRKKVTWQERVQNIIVTSTWKNTSHNSSYREICSFIYVASTNSFCGQICSSFPFAHVPGQIRCLATHTHIHTYTKARTTRTHKHAVAGQYFLWFEIIYDRSEPISNSRGLCLEDKTITRGNVGRDRAHMHK